MTRVTPVSLSVSVIKADPELYKKSAMDSASSNNEEFDDLPSSGNPTNQSVSQRFSSTSFRIPCRIFERSKGLFCSGVFLKGSAFAVGFWNPWKGFRSVMVMIILLLDVYYLFDVLYYAILCKRFDTPLNSWFCGNSSTTNSSSSTQPGILHGIELLSILSLVSNFAILMSNAAFFWCMWKLRERSVYCVTLTKAYSTTGRSIWVTLNCTMLAFGLCLLTKVFWFGLTFKGRLLTYFAVSLTIIPQWAILTSSWIFAIITNTMKDCVTTCHAEIRNAIDCSLDDIIRIHKRLCKQMSSTSDSLKVWFLVHWFLLAITSVIYVANMVSFFSDATKWYDFYHSILISLIHLYVFVYPSYCAASVTALCNRMLKELNMTTDEEWNTGHPFHSRSQLALFLQYAQFTNCGFQVGEVTFGTNFAWFSTLIAMCGLGVKVL